MKTNHRNTLVILSKVAGIGWFVAISVSLFSFIGFFLENKYSTNPFFILVGVFLGSLVAFTGVVKLLKKINNNK